MLGLTQLQKTFNQTIDLIHPGLLQPTEAYRLLRRELALSTFGFLCLFYKYKKIYQFQSKWLDVSPQRNQLCSVFEIYLLHVTSGESPHQTTLRPHHGYQCNPSCLLYAGPHNWTFCPFSWCIICASIPRSIQKYERQHQNGLTHKS